MQAPSPLRGFGPEASALASATYRPVRRQVVPGKINVVRIVGMELRLADWAAWREWSGVDMPSAVDIRVPVRVAGSARATHSGPRDIVELDEAISLLPGVLAVTVKEVYQRGATMPDHVRRLGCPEATIARRIGRAHQLLIGILAMRLADGARENERVTMSGRLTGPDRPA